MSRRLSSRLVVLIIVGSVLAGVAGVAVMIRVSADEAWDAMSRRTQELIVEASSRPSPRSVLRGAPLPGNAWTDYEIAIEEVKKSGGDFKLVERFAMGSEQVPRRLIDPETKQFASAIEAVRRGTQRADGSDPNRWGSYAEIQARPSRWCSPLAAIAVILARQMYEGGRHRESVELMFDILQFGCDLQRRTNMQFQDTGTTVVGYSLAYLGEFLSKGNFTMDELKELDRQLELIEHDWPDVTENLRNDAIVRRVALINGGPETSEIPQISMWSLLRYGFSKRLVAVDAIGWCDHFTERVIALERLPWREYLAARDAFPRELEKCPNPLVPGFRPLPKHRLTTGRNLIAQLRLLRVAVHYRMTGAFVARADPFGTELQRAESANTVTFWSLGLDGLDQGGNGHWWPDPTGGDMVLEVPK